MPTVTSLYERNTKLIDQQVANFYAIPGHSRADLVQEGRIALWEAAKAFDPGYGVPFRAFATIVIRKRLVDMLVAARRRKQMVLTESLRFWDARVEDGMAEQMEVLMQIGRLVEAAKELPPTHRVALQRIIDGRPSTGKAEDNARWKARRSLRKAVFV